MDKENFEGMPLTQAVKTWMDGEGWEDEIEVNENRSTSSVAVSMIIDEQSYKLFIETSEPDQQFFVYFYSPYNVPRQRLDVVVRILNRINARLAFGRLACDDGTEAGPIQFKCAIDVEGSTLSPIQVNTLIGLGVATFRDYGNVLAASCLTKSSIDEIWWDFLEQRGVNRCSGGGAAPRVLN